MRYLIIGAGGTGGCIGGYLAASGKEVSFIARGRHLEAIQEKGLIIKTPGEGLIKVENVKAYSGDDDFGKFDVIFVCVKGYSLNETIPVIVNAAHEHTIVIPVLNSLSVGENLARAMPGITVLDGCVYVAAYITGAGEITQGNRIFRIVYGPRADTAADPQALHQIKEDLEKSGIEAVVSDNIKADIFRKFSLTSAFAASGSYYSVTASGLQLPGEPRDTFISLLREQRQIASALGYRLSADLVEENLEILAELAPDTTVSMQKDLQAGRSTEADELIFDVVRIAEKCGVDVPNYRKIAVKLGMK